MLIVEIPGLSYNDAAFYAQEAQYEARKRAPKLSGESAKRIYAVYDEGWFGLHWLDDHVWFQEAGIRPFTMNSLQGKVIPMWVSDDDHKLRTENPKIETKTTADGRTLVRIFRRAANKGERKIVRRRQGGATIEVSVPRSYPGAPGRINRRHTETDRSLGKVAGRIAPTNVGVRWRHPGLASKGFMFQSLMAVVRQNDLERSTVITARAA